MDFDWPSVSDRLGDCLGRSGKADLVGKHVVVVANLKPARLRGVESQGMVLAAADGASVVLLGPERQVAAGTPIR